LVDYSILFRLFGSRKVNLSTVNTEETLVQTFCAMCGPSMGCGLNCYVANGKLVRVEGMKEAPTSSGKLCSRALASIQWLYSPQRLKFPLKRIGEKGDGKFKRISWDEALDIIASRLKEQKEKYGPESLAILSPQRRNYSEYLSRFLIAHGSPNYGHSGICAMQRAFSFAYTLGSPMLGNDYEHADLIIIWGANPAYSSSTGMTGILKAKKRGARLIVIKPQKQLDAAEADIWVPIRPGTDGALALAMLHVIINEELYDRDFVNKWCYGFDRLIPHVQTYTPEWAENVTGVPTTRIVDLARTYATTKSACINIGNAFDQMVDSSNAVRSVAILIAITGHLDRSGGNIVPTGNKMPRVKSVHLRERYTPEMVNKLVGPEFPLCFQPFLEGTSSAYYKCLDSVLTERPYPIRTIIAPGTQPTVITRGTPRIIQALQKLEFFVVIDVMETAAMPWADVVIPVATPYESDYPFEAAGNWIMARNKVVEPLGDYKSNIEFWLDLGVKMGYGADFWQGNIDACMNYQLEEFGLTIKQLREYPQGITYESNPMVYEKYDQMFSSLSNTLDRRPYLPQRKVAIYNTEFENNGFSPLPKWVAPPESPTSTPELLEKYPLILFDTHCSDAYVHGWLRNVPSLRKMQPEPWIQIHPDTAKVRNIADGDWVIVESPHGWIKVRAVYFADTQPDVVMSLHGWWQGCSELGLPGYPLLNGGANINIMYTVESDKAFDPLVTAMPKQTLVQVRKA
jgi:anaerobic selenocysteine-containing dehydrogenase